MFGTHREHHRLQRPTQPGRAGHRPEQRHLQFAGDLGHRRRRATLDGPEEDERAVLHQLAGVGLGGRVFVVVVQGAHDDLAAVHAAGGVQCVEVEFHARLRGHAVVVLAALQRDALADDQLGVAHPRVCRLRNTAHAREQCHPDVGGQQPIEPRFHLLSFCAGPLTIEASRSARTAATIAAGSGDACRILTFLHVVSDPQPANTVDESACSP
jgi:hypothetical protein